MTYAPVYLLPPTQSVPATVTPVAALLDTLEHVANTEADVFSSTGEKRLTLYLSAVCALAGTHDGAEGQDVYDRYARSLPDGTPLELASTKELRLYTLALHGLACDRAGGRARSLSPWLKAAGEALAEYRRPKPKAARSRPTIALTGAQRGGCRA